MTGLKTKTINQIIEIEGGYVDDPADSGGKTKYGITEAVARRYGYSGDMKDLPRDVAFTIYDYEFWRKLRLSEVENLSVSIAEELADTGVNQGIDRAAKFFQRALNVLNNRGQYFPDLKVDGIIGSRTLHAFSEYLGKRGTKGEVVMFRMLNSLQGAFYIELAERREKDEKFVFGWFLNRVA